MSLAAGKLIHRVAVQSSASVQGATGEPTKTWATESTDWALVEPISGREFFAAQLVSAEVTHRVRKRYRTGQTITPVKRLLFGTRKLEIVSAQNLGERNEEWEIMCRETV